MRHMNHEQVLFSLLFGMILFFGCNNNPANSGGSFWTQGTGVTNVNHFYGVGGNLFASTYCAPCSQAYIFLSGDEGLTWKLDTVFHVYNHFDNGYVTNGLYLAAPITFITDGRYLFAGVSDCYRGAIYRSSDNGIIWSNEGISWLENDSDMSENINCFSALNGDIFAGTYHGVFVSTDEGATWRASNGGMPITYTGRPPSISDLVAVGGYLFASTDGLGIFRSTNGGISWSQVDTTNYSFLGLTTIGTSIFAAAFNDIGKPWTGGVFISTDNGDSWQHDDVDLPDHGVGSICASGSYLFVGTETAVFTSSDLGATWIKISDGTSFSGATTTVSANQIYLFANSGGGVWRYPLFLLREFSQNTKNEISKKAKGE